MMVRAVCNLGIAPIGQKRARKPSRKLDVSLLPQKGEELKNKVSGIIKHAPGPQH